MPSRTQGSIHLFRIAGIDVYLHWWWFLIAVYEINSRKGSYSSIGWNVAEYLALFVIVLMHEFGHALACRQVGGKADTILLWPFGGVAYVDPPQRPGATLWSIAAGPLVNVALLPVFYELLSVSRSQDWSLDARKLLWVLLWRIDLGLLIFNILPVYPLDGGQILRSLLWFVLGKARSLMAATVIGFIGIAGFIGLALWKQDYWLGFICLYLLMSCWGGLQHALQLAKVDKLPRRHGFACPSCKVAPPVGDLWKCGKCGQAFDTFATQATCPYCQTHFDTTKCGECGASHPIEQWATTVLTPSGL